MRTRRIGSLEVSVVGVGTNNFGTDWFGAPCDRRQSRAVVDAALDSGINFFDTAEEYSVVSSWGRGESEQFLGAALGSRRDRAIIASKFQVEDLAAPGERGAARIRRAVDDSLRRLGTDYIDLYQQHNPDPDTPAEETLGALGELVAAGKVREIGCANFTGPMVDEAAAVAARTGTAGFRSAQNRYRVLDAARAGQGEQAELLAACERHGLKLIPYFPLANGVLTGKYNDPSSVPPGSRLATDGQVARHVAGLDLTEENLAIARALEAYARERGHTLLELALSWLVSQPLVATVIAGARRPEQAQANAVAGDWELTDADFAAIEEIVRRAGSSSGPDPG
jgi:aryl-alcohol dehydrogenase-like predicted oxidoreductase